jgi:hypothetical protein
MKRRERLKLSFRFASSQPVHTATLFAVFLIAMVGSLTFSELAVRRNNRLIAEISRSYGTVSIRPSPEQEEINYPHLGHLPGERTDWISEQLFATVLTLAETLELEIAPRIRGAVVSASGESSAFVARYTDDWSSEHREELSATAPLELAVQASEHVISFIPVPADAVTGRHGSPPHLWLDAEWLATAIGAPPGAHPVATEIVVFAAGDPLALAFDLRELLESRGVTAEVRAWGEILGIDGYAATQSGSAVEQFLILVVGVLAVAGVTSVSVHNRTEITVLMRTIGLSDDAIRRVFLLELVSLAASAVLVTGLCLLAVSLFTGLEMPVASVRRTLILGILVPPATGFFSIRRQLRHPLRVMRREALQ